MDHFSRLTHANQVSIWYSLETSNLKRILKTDDVVELAKLLDPTGSGELNYWSRKFLKPGLDVLMYAAKQNAVRVIVTEIQNYCFAFTSPVLVG